MTARMHQVDREARREIHEERLRILTSMPDATRTEVALAMGLSLSGMWHWARAHGLQLPSETLGQRRLTIVEAAIKAGKTRAQIAADLGLSRAGLNGWAATAGVPLPDDRTIKKSTRPMCQRCGQRQVTWGSTKPASHGLCPICRRAEVGTTCSKDGCTRPVNRDSLCTEHRPQEGRAIAFRQWSPKPTLLGGISPKAVATHHADCTACRWHRQAPSEAKAQALADDHNRRIHA